MATPISREAEAIGGTKKGPRVTCPACGSTDVTEPTFCSPSKRKFLGIARLMLGDPAWCDKAGRHLHQKCKTCGCAWTGTPVEIDPR